MKKTLIIGAFALLTLSACGNSNNTDTTNTGSTNTGGSVETTNTGDTTIGNTENTGDTTNTGEITSGTTANKTTPEHYSFGIENCDKYVGLMECVIEKIPAGSRGETITQYEAVIKMWNQFKGEELKSICDQTISSLQETKSSFEEIGCKF